MGSEMMVEPGEGDGAGAGRSLYPMSRLGISWVQDRRDCHTSHKIQDYANTTVARHWRHSTSCYPSTSQSPSSTKTTTIHHRLHTPQKRRTKPIRSELDQCKKKAKDHM